jgi:hypothetical protein
MEPGVRESALATHQVAPGIAAAAAKQHLASPLFGPGSLIDGACLTMGADTTMAFGKGVSGVSANSESLGFDALHDGAGYGSRSRRCRSYVVDIEVSSPRAYQAGFSIFAVNLEAWPSDSNLFWAACDGREEATFVYRNNSSQGGFKLVAKRIVRGQFVSGQCLMLTVSEVWPSAFRPQPGTTETYRIITRASASFTTNWVNLGVLYWHRLVVATQQSTT